MKSKKLLIGFLTFMFTVGVMFTSSVSFGQALGLNWTSLGPDNYAGRTRALLLSNEDPQHKTLFAGSVTGGLWKSTTNGLTWTQIHTDNVVLNISCMAQSPNGDIYVGTGEKFASERFNIFSGFIGQGIYKSTDGETFARLESTNPGSNNDPSVAWAYVNKIAAGDNKVYAATNSGLKVSMDGGQSWVNAKAEGVELTAAANDVSLASDGAVVASVGNKVYLSTDGSADNFVLISGETGENELPHNSLSRINLAFAPSDASVIYAMLIGDGSDIAYLKGMMAGIYVSNDKGQTWRLIAPGGSDLFNVTGVYGDYASTLIVSEENSGKIYAAGMGVWEGLKIQEEGFYQWQLKTGGFTLVHDIAIEPGSEGNVVYVSTDEGVFSAKENFQVLTGLNRNYRTSMFYTVAVDDKGRAIGGTQGNGILYLDGKGNSPEAANNIYPAFTGGSVEMSMIDPKAIFYSAANGDLVRSADLGVSVANDFVPEDISSLNATVLLTPFKHWESFNNVNTVDSVSFVAKQNYAAGETVEVKSRAGGFPFHYTLTEDLVKGDSVIVQDIITSRFFLGMSNSVYMTKEVLDFGKEPKWFKIAAINGVTTAMGLSDDANYLFVGTANGNVYRIANLAQANDSVKADVSSTSCIVSTTLIQSYPGRNITSVSVDQNNSARILVTMGTYGNDSYVAYSTNALDQTPTFASAQGNLPKMPVYSSLFEMNTSNILIGTDLGIYTTKSLGENTTWTAENSGMGALPVMAIRQQTVTRPYINGFTEVANRGAIYIASLGNGLFENKLYVGFNRPAVNKPLTAEMLNVFPNPVNNEFNFVLDLNRAENVSVKIYDLRGNVVMAQELGQIQKGSVKIALSADNLSSGTYFMQVLAGKDVRNGKFVVIK